MRGLSSNVLAVAAMGLSTLTTYLTFFDASYRLTTAIAAAPVTWQTGSSYSPDRGRTASYDFFVAPSVVLSNRGTLAVVLSDVELVTSKSLDKCDPTDEKPRALHRFRGQEAALPAVIEPETVKQVDFEFSLKKVRAEADEGGQFDIPPTKQLFCIRWTIFDPNGRRHEPMIPAVTLDVKYEMEGEKKYPTAKVEKDFPKGPKTLVARGVL